ncbi:Uncharacterised protein [Anaerostipes hadrus]|jgi:hypothetical protein|uniref:Phage major tail protein, TP901-1 family n=1 Tax=Anaerostipes hadrus TaxID=649756 RepID=A0A173TVC6_ANAHA|nr:hypothetical protein [Anaerostipes hadrus]CUN06631.1 Uncharacterised protein [Anaerostipes hadrus]DAQ17963.1 MAG TPA: hypothetical protein [Bacteriophage sp.]
MAAVTTGKIARKYMAHFLDSGSLCGGTSGYERLGKDLEEYNVELNPDTETSKNIIGESTFKHNGYEVSSEADPYYAEADSVLSQKLQEIVDNRYTDDNLKTNAVEVHMWKEATSGAYEAYQQECYVTPTSYGGDTSGYQIPFTVNYVGERTKGTYNVTTGKFTAATSSVNTSSTGK